VLALDDVGAQVDTRHFEDESEAAPTTRLQGVQESIRRFDPKLIGEHAADARADASLRVHACHTRLRELEVLRDALLDARSARPDLKPSDIVVMMPDIHAYLPLIPAVFGEAGKHEARCRITAPTSPSRVRIRCSRRSAACSTCRNRA
jgi:exodeoxyribonuclease V gamma subunit